MDYIKEAERKINQSRTMLNCMKLAKADFKSDVEIRKRYGARNFLIYNNSVTHVLQNLRSIVGQKKFDDWYTPYSAKLSNDKVLRRIYKMRSETIKEGETHFGTHGQTIILNIDEANNTQNCVLEGEPILELWDLKELSGTSTIDCMDYAIAFFDEMLNDAENYFAK